MTREDFLIDLLKKQGHTIQGFARQIRIPTSTLRSIMKNVGGASCDNIFKICAGLGITADELNDLTDDKINSISAQVQCNDKDEQNLLDLYRRLLPDDKIRIVAKMEQMIEDYPENQPARTTIFRAAKSTDNHPHEIIETDKDFSKIPPTKIKL